MSENKTNSTDYSKISDDELILLSQSGDNEALEAVLVKYQPLVYKKSRPYYLAGGDSDDVIQEGLIGLYKAVMSFDKTKFPLFNVFAGVCIERRIMSAVKKATRLKHTPLNSYVSLSEPDSSNNTELCDVMHDDISVTNPESILIEKENAQGLEGKINNALSSFEMEVLQLSLNGSTYKEIANVVARDTKAVDNAMQRIKKKLEQVLK